MVDFSQHDMTLRFDRRSQRVSIAANALECWWGAEVGPQTLEGLIADHIHEVEVIVAHKLTQGMVEADGSIVVTDDDLD